MKAIKALKRLTKAEALLSNVIERYAASGHSIQEVLQNAKASVIRAKDAVGLQASHRHLHVSSCGPTAVRFGPGSRSAIFVQAGTACSTRGRGEPNSYNVIRLDDSSIEILTLSAALTGYAPSSVQRFDKSPSGWVQNGDKTLSTKQGGVEQR
jgi:hypothetical protein